MRNGVTQEVQDTLAAVGITTGLAARLDFQSETLFVWTGAARIMPSGSGETLLDGNTFEPLAQGVIVDVGENTYTMTGSDEFQISLAIPADASSAITASQIYPAEYQSRPATIWRVFLYPQTDPLAPPLWLFRRIRAGSMDKVEIQNDGQTNKFLLTIESHQSTISNATNQTYLDQPRYDPNDTSQDYAVSIANGDPAPTKGYSAGSGGGSGGGTSNGDDGGRYNRINYLD